MIQSTIPNEPMIMQFISNINISFEFLFSMIEDIQDLAKFNNNQEFTLDNEFMDIQKLIKELRIIFEDQCKVKNLELFTNVNESVPQFIYADPKRLK